MTAPAIASRYVSRPVEVDISEPWDGSPRHARAIVDWVHSGGGKAEWIEPGRSHHLRRSSEYRQSSEDEVMQVIREDAPAFIVIVTLEGPMRADPGDRIIRGTEGEHYPIKPDPFERKYDLVATKYRVLRRGDYAKPGDLVRSIWSSSGAVWRVEGTEDPVGRIPKVLRIVSTSSGRHDTRYAKDMNVVEVVS